MANPLMTSPPTPVSSASVTQQIVTGVRVCSRLNIGIVLSSPPDVYPPRGVRIVGYDHGSWYASLCIMPASSGQLSVDTHVVFYDPNRPDYVRHDLFKRQ